MTTMTLKEPTQFYQSSEYQYGNIRVSATPGSNIFERLDELCFDVFDHCREKGDWNSCFTEASDNFNPYHREVPQFDILKDAQLVELFKNLLDYCGAHDIKLGTLLKETF